MCVSQMHPLAGYWLVAHTLWESEDYFFFFFVVFMQEEAGGRAITLTSHSHSLDQNPHIR